jgi:hypothetical protein
MAMMEVTMHHAEAIPTDWLELAEETRRLSEADGISDERREMLVRSAMHYEVEALAAHLFERIPMKTEDIP